MQKINIMDAFNAELSFITTNRLLGFPDYTAFFISSKEKATFNKTILLDKRIGLLDYPTSRSGAYIA
ncbi:hypothetical protein ACOBV8_20385 (plasmid) [Pseudoalteromonas espejiana]